MIRTGFNLPDGQITIFCPDPREKLFRWCRRANQGHLFARPFPKEGRWPTSSTRDEDAVDAGCAVGRTARMRTANSCGPDAPVLASSLWIRSQATVARKPVTGESTKETVKTIAQGRPDCLR